MEEVWKTITNYPNYQVSSLGRVKSIKRQIIDSWGRTHNIPEKIIFQRLRKDGYYDCKLCKNGKYKQFLVHRLVAQEFVTNPNPLEYDCVDHIDTNRQNSCVDNLRWVNHKLNQNNPLTVQHMKERPLPNEEIKRKMSLSTIGEKNHFYGKHHTEQTKQMIADKNSVAIICVETQIIYKNSVLASKAIGVRNTAINNCLKGRSKTCGGYHWKYIDDNDDVTL